MKILVPLDENRQSLAAVDFVAARSPLVGRHPDVVLFNALWPPPRKIVQVVGHGRLRTLQDRSAERVFGPALRTLDAAKLKPRTMAVAGHPGEQIARAAQKSRADLIVMTSRVLPLGQRLFFGSVTNSVLARTKTPLLVLRERSAARGKSLRVGIAVDGTRYGAAAVRYVLKNAELFGARPEIRLIHVVSPVLPTVVGDVGGLPMPAYTAADLESVNAAAFEAAVGAARKLLRKAGARFDEVKLTGNAGDELARYAKSHLDVLVMGTHGRGAFTAAVLGSVATRVATKCSTPLLLVRRG